MELTRYVVGAHETFPLRAGWLKKGFDAAKQDPFAFQRADAVVRFGVGKNMVRSIRFWCLAVGVLEETTDGSRLSAAKTLRPTELGERLFGDHGWDPYLEDPASAWLVHFLLVTNPLKASAWWYVFGAFPDNEFTKARLVSFLASVAEKQGQQVSSASIARDVECFLNTYTVGVRSSKSLYEAPYESPLVELNLIGFAGADGIYRFLSGRKENLPSEVVAFALFRFFLSHVSYRKSLSLRECLYTPGSPGQVFRLDETSLLEHLEALMVSTPGLIDVVETAGTTQIFFAADSTDDLEGRAIGLLDRYFSKVYS